MARRVADAPIFKKSFQEFSETMSVKVQGTLNIDAVTAGESLDFFLIFSSTAAFEIKGSTGDAYSTAFQNAFTRYRNRLVEQGKRTGLSRAICWGQFEQCENQYKQPYVLEKRWTSLNITSDYLAEFSGTVLILANEDTLKLAKTFIKNAAIQKKSILVLKAGLKNTQQSDYIIDCQNYAAGQRVAEDLLHNIKDIECIIDLSDLYQLSKDHDHEQYGKIGFYQKIITLRSALTILYITKGLQSFRSKEMSLAGAKFAGLIKMLSVEYNFVRSIAIDLDNSCYNGETLTRIIGNELRTAHKETEVCHRESGRFVPYVHKIDMDRYRTNDQSLNPFNINQKGVYVLSGGTGGIGLEVANYFVEKGARHIVLMGKTSLPPKDEWNDIDRHHTYSTSIKDKVTAIVALEKKGCSVDVYSGDLMNYQSMLLYFRKISESLGEIKGVVHAANSSCETNDVAFINKHANEFQSIYETKVNGLDHLQKIFKDNPLDFFISFSSSAGQVPYFMRGLSCYGMANSYLDFVTDYQVFNGNTYFRSIAWVGWTDVGAHKGSERLETTQTYAGKLGLLFNNPEEGIGLLASAMMVDCQSHNLLPCLLDKNRFNTSRQHFYTAVKSEELYNDEAGIDAESAIVLMDLSLKSAFEVPGFVAVNDKENALRIMGFDQGGSTDEETIFSRIEAFENDELSKQQFITFLKSLTDNDYTESIQNKIFHAIRRSDRKRVGRFYWRPSISGDRSLTVSKKELSLANELAKPVQNEPGTEERIEKLIAERIRDSMENVLKIRKDTLDWDQPFQYYGLDSISAMQLATLLEKELNLSIQPKWFIEHPTINFLANKLSQENKYQRVTQ